MRVDAHHHVWDLTVRDQPWTADLPSLQRSFAIEELEPRLVEHHIDATVVVQTLPVAGETPELLTLAAAHRVVAGVVGWVDLTLPDVGEGIAEMRARPGGDRLLGVRHPVQDEADPDWLHRLEVRRGLSAVAAHGLAFDLLVNAGQLDAAIRVVRDLADVRFVLDHAGKPLIQRGALDPWRRQMKEFADLPNVVVKLSGLVTEAGPGAWTVDTLRPYAETLLAAFGPDRIMYGSDWPVCLLAGTYADVIDAAEQLTGALSPDEQSAIFGATAQRWYRMADPHQQA